MELRCYSYDGGAPPMDSWSLEEKMGVARRAALQGLIKALSGHQDSAAALRPGSDLCNTFNFQLRVPIPVLFEISVRCVHVLRPEEACVCAVIVEKSPGARFRKKKKKKELMLKVALNLRGVCHF